MLAGMDVVTIPRETVLKSALQKLQFHLQNGRIAKPLQRIKERKIPSWRVECLVKDDGKTRPSQSREKARGKGSVNSATSSNIELRLFCPKAGKLECLEDKERPNPNYSGI